MKRLAKAPSLAREAGTHLHSSVADLTPRQAEVLRLVAEGLSNRQVAQRLVISLATVENHLHAIFGKLGVGSRTEAAVLAALAGMLVPANQDEESPLLPFEVELR